MPPLPTLADQIDALLPQTQCEQCGYHGCRPYAEAIADGSAAINQCPPGGQLGIERIADLLGIAALPLNPENGEEKPRTLARIIESQCIGCTKCIQVCPVDAIVGANKLMHTVVADICTGCERCVPACPVDCIVLEPMPLAQANDPAHADQARRDFQRRETRLAALQRQRETELLNRKAQVQGSGNSVLDALARARARKQDPNA